MTAPAGLIPISCEVWIDDVRYRDGRAGETVTDPFVTAPISITWGRDTTVDQPGPATCTFTIMDPAGGSIRFDDTVSLGSTVVVWAEMAGSRTPVFGGRITDLDAEYDSDAAAGVCHIIAADVMADLANRYVGAEPWAMQNAGTRAARILSSVTVTNTGLVMASRAAALAVSRVDVDRQPAAALLRQLAITTGTVLWSAYDPSRLGPYLYFEDPSARSSLYQLIENVDTLLWSPAPGAAGGVELSACQVLQSPVLWSRAVSDLITRATVRWADQSTAPFTTERSVALVAESAEATYGARGLSVSTLLTSALDATALATTILASHQPSPAWRTAGLLWDLAVAEIDDDGNAAALAFALLGTVTRLGLAVALTDLPYWTPTAAAVLLYVEGGTYTYGPDPAGTMRWTLALTAAPATGLGGSLTYAQSDDSIRYKDVARSVTFLSMIGVGPATGTGAAWTDLAGSWAGIPITTKWSDL